MNDQARRMVTSSLLLFGLFFSPSCKKPNKIINEVSSPNDNPPSTIEQINLPPNSSIQQPILPAQPLVNLPEPELPKSQNYSEAKAKKIDDYLIPFFSKDTPSCTFLAKDNDGLIYLKSFGMAQIELSKKAEIKTKYRVASLTKLITALTFIKTLYDYNIDFQQSLATITRPDSPPNYWNSIKPIHLIDHTSGLRDYHKIIPWHPHPLTDLEIYDALLKQRSGLYTPGSKYRYSNSGYAMMAALSKKISGKKFEDLVKEYIFTPAKMKQSSLAQISGDVKNRAKGYSYQNNKYVVYDQNWATRVQGDGGLITTVVDYYKFIRQLENERIIEKNLLLKVFNQLNSSYRFGLNRNLSNGIRVLSHSGVTAGHRHYMLGGNFGEFVIGLCNRSGDSFSVKTAVRKIREILRGPSS